MITRNQPKLLIAIALVGGLAFCVAAADWGPAGWNSDSTVSTVFAPVTSDGRLITLVHYQEIGFHRVAVDSITLAEDARISASIETGAGTLRALGFRQLRDSLFVMAVPMMQSDGDSTVRAIGLIVLELRPAPVAKGDVNGDGELGPVDLAKIVDFLFSGGSL